MNVCVCVGGGGGVHTHDKNIVCVCVRERESDYFALTHAHTTDTCTRSGRDFALSLCLSVCESSGHGLGAQLGWNHPSHQDAS